MNTDNQDLTAEQLARLLVTNEVFDNLPPTAQQNLITQQQSIIDSQHDLLVEREQLAADRNYIESSRMAIERSRLEIEANREEIDFFRRNMFLIDRSTPTVTEMEVTLSEKRLEQSLEYKQLGQELLIKTETREITAEEMRDKLDDKIIQLKRLMDARRKREARSNSASSSRKKVERDYLKLVSRGWRSTQVGMEFMSRRELVDGENFSVEIPAEVEFIDRAMLMQRHILEERPTPRPEHYCMGSITIRGATRFLSKTKLIPILTPDGDTNTKFYNDLRDMVKAMLDRMENYEEKDSEVVCDALTISYTISQWESIDNWFPNQIMPPTLNYKDFTVFLASDIEYNCIEQIVEYLNYKWDPTKKIEEIITDKPILTYIPTQGDMRYVKCYSDLITSFNEHDNTDCTNVIRIIKWEAHAALITNIKPQKNKSRVQVRKLAEKEDKKKKTKNVEVFVDIESFSRYRDDKYMEQIPYLICWTDNDEVSNATGIDCITQFVDNLLEKYHDSKSITLFAWYGSGYDYQHIYKYLKAKCTRDTCHMRNNSIIYVEFFFQPLMLTIHLKDPYLFILTSLDKAAKAFKVLNKGSFPHTIIKEWGDLDKVLENWLTLRTKTITDDNGKVMLIHVDTFEEIEENPNTMTIMERAKEYCTIDVLALKQVWNKFSTLVEKELGTPIDDKVFTLSQLSMKILENHIPKNVWLYVPDRELYDFIKDGIYGGRVYAQNGDYKEDIYYADVVSLYPSAMRLCEHGYGKPCIVNEIDWSKHGIYNVNLTHKKDFEPKEYMNFVPRRIDGKLTWKWFKRHTGAYHTYDLLIAKEQGFDIKVNYGIEYPSKGYIFNDYIDKLYKLKDTHSKCDCGSQPCPIRWIAKIALNGGGYGKFVQKPIDLETYIVRKDVIAGECAKLEENKYGEVFFGGNLIKRPIFQALDGDEYDKMMFEIETEPYYATQNGISILSASRYRLYCLIKEFPCIQVLYSDTDSIFVKASSVNRELWMSKMGTELGQLDDTVGDTKHGVINHLLVGGPKMYAYEYSDKYGLPKVSMHCKGIPLSMLELKHFEHLLSVEDKYLSYKFTIMKKRLVGVSSVEVNKIIKQT